VNRVLVDTSVWRKYFSGATAAKPLAALLEDAGFVLVHPFIVGELLLGGLSQREEKLFELLPNADVVSHDEVLELVRRRRLARRGIGWVDAHLLASALTSSAQLWAMDADLQKVATDLNIDFHGELTT
jgi:hypothetical protein